MHDDPTLPLTETQRGPSELALARDRWGEFKLLARVGHGGFGEVYRAWDPSLEREVALKLLLPTVGGRSQSEEEYKSMLREARALAAIRHPNIVSVYGIDRHDGRVGFWTDFVKGKTLSSLLGAQGAFGYREAALIGLDLARALSAVHRAGLLHRDIKAENVMREEGGRILLMDFGLSALPQRQTDVAGTPNYMAPELWQGQPATVQTDIYAMGVLLYFMVTGEHPVKLGGLTAAHATAALAKRRPLLDLRPDLPEPFLRAVSTATESDPAKRFPSAGQLAAALAECLGTTAHAEVQPQVPRWRTSLAFGMAAVVLVVAVVGWRFSAVKGSLHVGSGAVSAGAPGGTYDDYLKAQDLLQHSYKSTNLVEAVKGFQSVLKKDPKFALAQAGLGAAYFAQYRNASDPKLLGLAKAATDQALTLDPNQAPAYVTQARMLAMAGQTALAMQAAQRAIGLDPRSADAYGALAEVYEAQGKNDDAINTIGKAIDLAPENSNWLVKLGNYHLSDGQAKEAAAAWQKAVDIDSQNVAALFDLGIVGMRAGKLEEARANFERVLRIEPDADSYETLGIIAMLEGRYDEAEKMARRAIELNPQGRSAWGNLASAYMWSGERGKALDSYGKAIILAQAQREHAPEDTGILAELANYYASIGDAAHCLPLLNKSLALAPDDPRIAYLSGESYELLGDRSRAIPLISRALAKGYQASVFERSPEMASLRSDPSFQSALAAAKAKNALDTGK